MRELGRIPAEGVVEADVDRRGRDPLLAAQDVADRHQVVVDDVGQVIGRVAVRLEQDQVFEVGVLKDDLAAQEIHDPGLTVQRHAEANGEGHPGGEIRLDLLRGEIAAEAVVARRFLARRLLLPHLLQALRRAEAAVGMPARQQSRGVLPVEVGPLTLAIGTERAADVRPLVPIEAEPAQDIDDSLLGPFDVAVAIGVLDAEQEGALPSLARGLPVRQ